MTWIELIKEIWRRYQEYRKDKKQKKKEEKEKKEKESKRKDTISPSEFGSFSRAPGQWDAPVNIEITSANKNEIRFAPSSKTGGVHEWIIASSGGHGKAKSDKAASHGRSTNWNKHFDWPAYVCVCAVSEGRRKCLARSPIVKVD